MSEQSAQLFKRTQQNPAPINKQTNKKISQCLWFTMFNVLQSIKENMNVMIKGLEDIKRRPK